jgi:hypothetical protein
MRDSINSAVQIFRSNPESSDDEIFNRFLESGIERLVATQLIVLLPLAYGRVVLSEMGASFPNTYICIGANGKSGRQRSLNSLPLWVDAVGFARQDAEPPFPIASRSAEVRVANEALLNGSKLENLVWSPPVFTWPEFESSANSAAKASRRWWQVWKC